MLFQFEKTKTIDNAWCEKLRITHAKVIGTSGFGVGIDPGVNFGIALLIGGEALVYHGTLSKQHEIGMYGAQAYSLLRSLMIPKSAMKCIIEGAAYNKQFGQVGLTEVRIGFFLSALFSGSLKDVHIVPPATIRKKVFGFHLQQAGDVWVNLNHNAADSLSMALYAADLLYGKDL